jgi:hypothetical protein
MTIIAIAAIAAASFYTYRSYGTHSRVSGIMEVAGLFAAVAQSIFMILDALSGRRPSYSGNQPLRRPGIQIAADVAE